MIATKINSLEDLRSEIELLKKCNKELDSELAFEKSEVKKLKQNINELFDTHNKEKRDWELKYLKEKTERLELRLEISDIQDY